MIEFTLLKLNTMSSSHTLLKHLSNVSTKTEIKTNITNNKIEHEEVDYNNILFPFHSRCYLAALPLNFTNSKVIIQEDGVIITRNYCNLSDTLRCINDSYIFLLKLQVLNNQQFHSIMLLWSLTLILASKYPHLVLQNI